MRIEEFWNKSPKDNVQFGFEKYELNLFYLK